MTFIRPWLAMAIPAIATSLVETIQRRFLLKRIAAFSDVLANTVGGLLGLLCAVLVLRSSHAARASTARAWDTPAAS